ncbi:MAG TPA: hypothetical protein VFS84_00265 [Candidatus Binatia bacterium]|nr:hypothetical protein [Candidatus Binatia bacterium]HEU4637260.1 hypothetical protein [Candidatus Binatia bacterium]
MNRAVVTIQSTAVGSFFEPDVLTSHQYFQLFRQKSHFGAEEKLLFAVLTDAIECFQKYLGVNAPRRRKLFTEAAAWISRRDSSWPYSFENICEALNIDPNYLRLGLMQWRIDHDSQKNTGRCIRKTLRYQHTVKQNRVYRRQN